SSPADQTPDQAFGLPEVLVAVSTSRLSCKRAGKTRTLMPVWDSYGESRFRREQLQGASTHMKSKYVQLACMLVLAAGVLAIRSVPLLATSAEYASLSARNLYAVNQSSKNRGSISIYDKVTVEKENTTIVSGAGKKTDIQARIGQIKAQ